MAKKKTPAKKVRKKLPPKRKPVKKKPAKKKASGRTEKFIPEWMQSRSDVSKKSWQKRWDRGTAPVGTKGRSYIEKTYGPEVRHETPLDYRQEEEPEEYDDFDFWDSEY